MYDLGEFPRLRANFAKQMRSGILEAVRGTGAADAAYVRCTMYDVRSGEFPRLRANLAAGAAYVRFSMDDGGA